MKEIKNKKNVNGTKWHLILYVSGKTGRSISALHNLETICEKYLKGLWQACLSCGATFDPIAVQSLQELHDFDRIIVTMGADTTTLPELAHLSISRTKGQLLELSWPQDLPFLHCPLNSSML